MFVFFRIFLGMLGLGVLRMKLWKNTMLFCTGGSAYVALELLWRGWSHGSMFLAGGSCFLLLGKLGRVQPMLPLPARAVVGALIITSVELMAGLIANRDYSVWDYRNVPFNFHGQICLPFSLLWLPVSLGAMVLYDTLDKKILPVD